MPQLLLISNRLPWTARLEQENITLARSSGGLATGLAGVHAEAGSRWMGWPGDVSDLDPGQRLELGRRFDEERALPVYLSPEQIHSFYEGFSNGVLWPLFHYLIDRVQLDANRDWAAYKETNQLFAEAAAQSLEPGGTAWIHDYQLMLMPGMLRQLVPEARIGYFLHIPFPSPEVYRILPWRRELLLGLLGADLIGFHTHAYLRNFIAALRYVLGLQPEFDTVRHEGRQVRLGVFPMGIDAESFAKRAASEEVLRETAGWRKDLGERKLIVSVDRLDYTKGIRRRLLALQQLLENYPLWRSRVRFVQVAVPSRTGVEEYGKFRRGIDELVGRINGRYSTVDWVPVHYLYRSVSPKALVSLYRAADVMVVTPLRDGMNLVSKEFIAARPDEDGVLVLSEFAGAAAELAEAVQVNPYDLDRVAEALDEALSMPARDRRERMRALRRRVFAKPVREWAADFLRVLGEAGAENASRAEKISSEASVDELLGLLASASARIILTDYDGTLVPFARSPMLAAPDAGLLELLRRLAVLPSTQLHIVSGRPREVMEEWLGELPVGLHAEHGFWSRPAPDRPWQAALELPPPWRERVLPVLESFTSSTPGSIIEEKSASIAWHYRMSDPEFGEAQATQLRRILEEMLASTPAGVLTGSKIVEVRFKGIHKGRVVGPLLAAQPPGTLALALGDDRTDEELFAALPPGSIAIHVGTGQSQAPHRLASPAAVREFLRRLAERLPPTPA